jgi:hypothetical protein
MQERRRKAVLGMYPTRSGVEIAVEAFRDAGFENGDISLVLPEEMMRDDFSSQELDDLADAALLELAATLIGLGVPQHETRHYAGKVLRGTALLSIQCDSAERAFDAQKLHGDLGGMDVFVAQGAERFSEPALARAAGW